MSSKKYSLNGEDLQKIVSALMWSALSTVIGSLILIVPNIAVPTAFIVLVPIVNTLLYTLKKFIDGRI